MKSLRLLNARWVRPWKSAGLQIRKPIGVIIASTEEACFILYSPPLRKKCFLGQVSKKVKIILCARRTRIDAQRVKALFAIIVLQLAAPLSVRVSHFNASHFNFSPPTMSNRFIYNTNTYRQILKIISFLLRHHTHGHTWIHTHIHTQARTYTSTNKHKSAQKNINTGTHIQAYTHTRNTQH